MTARPGSAGEGHERMTARPGSAGEGHERMTARPISAGEWQERMIVRAAPRVSGTSGASARGGAARTGPGG
ncbi:hypothetical protein Aau02nite_84700 [Amorphoplanes auranticolor]|uniref:Uncharacterized protein n=1 Tax=Actinoplanes auranticolor TaxID=47988 RepID=A0A919SY05_9ACTN|nr:hypothetical protein Aau02nite_84700 [Actinoplanes auranticolor]